MDLIQIFLSNRGDISPLRNETSDPPVGVLHQPLFPRVVWVCKIDTRVEERFQFSPARESDVVVRGDALQISTMEQLGKRSTNSVAFSIWKLNYPCSFGETINYDK